MRSKLVMPALAVVLAIVLAACGSSSGGGDTSGKGDTAAVDAAKTATEAASAELTFTAPGPAIDAAKARGKSIHIVAVNLAVPILAHVAKYVKEVGATLGIKVTVSNADDQVTGMQQGIQVGITQKSDVILILGVPTDLVRDKLRDAKAAGIPVINVLNNPIDMNAPGQGAGEEFYASVGTDLELGGRLIASKAVLDTNGKANVLFVDSEGLAPEPPVVKGIKEVLEACKGCKLQVKNVPLADWGTQITPLVVTSIRANPNLNYVLTLFDGMAIFATAGVQQAGAVGKVHVSSHNGGSAGLALVKQGDVFTADPGVSEEWSAWATVDQSMRAMLKLPPGNPLVPYRYLDTAMLKDIDVNDERAVYGDSFIEGFKKLWGIA
ncbi:MAG: sugar ABC transporter substrate-binding protein [Nocardioidaceae bacterium]|nr:sugar ABC transporter substrate-binding protein [Nocardioidaceae bacterium]